MLISALFTLGGQAVGLMRRGQALDWRIAPRKLRRAAVAWRGPRAAAPLAPLASLAAAAVTLPQGLELASLLAAARSQFVRLQAAWDAGDVELLGQLTAPAVWRELCAELPARGSGANCTEVLALQARLLDCVEAPGAWLLSVEFTGVLREGAGAGAEPFHEWWMLAREKSPAGGDEPPWRLMRQQTLF